MGKTEKQKYELLRIEIHKKYKSEIETLKDQNSKLASELKRVCEENKELKHELEKYKNTIERNKNRVTEMFDIMDRIQQGGSY